VRNRHEELIPVYPVRELDRDPGRQTVHVHHRGSYRGRWAASGPLFHFTDTWQLVINTGTTIVTFLMVFLIQNTQNRDGMALQAKLDELIHAMDNANNAMLDLEELDEQTLTRLHNHYCRVAKQARDKLEDLLDQYEQENDRDEAEKDRTPAAEAE
jgi:low affinity Fe/Cu permease